MSLFFYRTFCRIFIGFRSVIPLVEKLYPSCFYLNNIPPSSILSAKASTLQFALDQYCTAFGQVLRTVLRQFVPCNNTDITHAFPPLTIVVPEPAVGGDAKIGYGWAVGGFAKYRS